MKWFPIPVVFAFVAFLDPLNAQPTSLQFRQTANNARVEVLTPAEIATLGDPMFQLVLKNKANLTTLTEIEKAIQPEAKDRKLFVVSEAIVRSSKEGGRRAVMGFDGKNGGESLKANVMLSFSFGTTSIPESIEIEAWGWDNHRGRYNYYKLDSIGAPPNQVVWKFRGSSENADLLTPAQRSGTCMACHVTGAPVMKEFQFPWNNWHAKVGASFPASYLDPNDPNPNKWPIATTPRFAQLAGADLLERDFLMPAFKRFNQSRLNSALMREDATGDRNRMANGRMTVLEGRRLLRPLFETVEVNLASSRDTSGFHLFGTPNEFVPDANILIPDNFFLNTRLIADLLQLTNARAEFRSFGKLTQLENKKLIEGARVRLGGVPGDTHFAWFVPEPGFSDTDLADQLLKLGVISPHFLASLLAVDLETPIFSNQRARLLRFIPDRFEFTSIEPGTDPLEMPRDAASDLLTREVIGLIDAAQPAMGSSADRFRKLLKSEDAVKELDQLVKAYAMRVKGELDPQMPVRRETELKRLYQIALDRRRDFRRHPVLGNLDETQGQLLFPLPSD